MYYLSIYAFIVVLGAVEWRAHSTVGEQLFRRQAMIYIASAVRPSGLGHQPDLGAPLKEADVFLHYVLVY